MINTIYLFWTFRISFMFKLEFALITPKLRIVKEFLLFLNKLCHLGLPAWLIVQDELGLRFIIPREIRELESLNTFMTQDAKPAHWHLSVGINWRNSYDQTFNVIQLYYCYSLSWTGMWKWPTQVSMTRRNQILACSLVLLRPIFKLLVSLHVRSAIS